ncbi:MAG: hypothetical protein AAF479_17910, partial [Pseudomonadota bacterium]
MKISILGFIFCCFASGASVWIVTGAPGLSSPLDPATQYYRAIEAAEAQQRQYIQRQRESVARSDPRARALVRTVIARAQGSVEADRSLVEIEVSTVSPTLQKALSSLEDIHVQLQNLLKEKGYLRAKTALSNVTSQERKRITTVSHTAKGKVIIRFGALVDPIDFLKQVEIPEIRKISKVAYWIEDAERQTASLKGKAD